MDIVQGSWFVDEAQDGLGEPCIKDKLHLLYMTVLPPLDVPGISRALTLKRESHCSFLAEHLLHIYPI